MMSRPCSIHRLWVMLLKHKCPTTSPPSSLVSSALQTSSPQDVCSPSSLLIQRPEYTPSIRSQVVQIYIHHLMSREIPMDFTPCVGEGIKHLSTTNSHEKNGCKRNLYYDLSSIDKHHQPKNVHCKRDCNSFQSPLDDDNNMFESYDQGVSCSSYREQKQAKFCQCDTPYMCSHKLTRVQRSGLETPKNFHGRDISVLEAPSRVQGRSVIETPKHTCGKNMSVLETPTVPSVIHENHHCVTPSKILTTQLGNFSLSDTLLSESQSCTLEHGMWYQIDQPLYGFKGVYLKT